MKTRDIKREVRICVKDLGMRDEAEVVRHLIKEYHITEDEQEIALNLARNSITDIGLGSELLRSTDVLLVCEDFIEQHPIYYDRERIWWVWDDERRCFGIRDKEDLMNALRDSLGVNDVVKPNIRATYLNGLAMVARKNAPEELGKNFIQFKDCVVDLKTEDTKPFVASPEFFYTNPIPWSILDAINECPTIDAFFEEWVGKEQKQILYEICAYCLLRDYPIHRLFCLIGGGRNGKGTFIKILKKLLGISNVTSSDLDRLVESRFEVGKLYKKLALFMGETNFAMLNKTSIIKSAVGQDLISGEFKGVQPFDFENYAKVIIATNSLPATADKTVGFYSRWIIIEFNKEYEIERDMIEKIPNEEFNALAKKCVPILKNVLMNGKFTDEGNWKDKQEKYEAKSNPLRSFINETMDFDSSSHVWFYEAFDKFSIYLSQRRMRAVSQKEFSFMLNDMGIDIMRVHTENKSGEDVKWNALMGYRWKDNSKVTTVSDAMVAMDTQSILPFSVRDGIESRDHRDHRDQDLESSQKIGLTLHQSEGRCHKCDALTFQYFHDPYAIGHPIIYQCENCSSRMD